MPVPGNSKRTSHSSKKKKKKKKASTKGPTDSVQDHTNAPPTEDTKQSPSIVTKSLFWKKLKTDETSIWQNLVGSDVQTALDGETRADFVSTFSRHVKKKQLTENERIGQEVGAIGGVLKKGSLTFMDQKRFNNVALKLSQLRCSNEKIRDAVLSVDLAFLTPEKTGQILACAPTGDDLESIAPYDGDPDLLAQCERFFFDVQHVPHFTKRLESILLLHQFKPACMNISRALGSIALASAALLGNSRLKLFVAVVRELGNILNEGHESRSGATAFSFDVLPKLGHVKSADGKTNLMRWISAHLKAKHGIDASEIVSDFACTKNASRASFERVESSLRTLARDFNVIQRCIKAVKFQNSKKNTKKFDNDVFVERMVSLSRAISMTIGSATRQLEETKFLFQSALKSWGMVQENKTKGVSEDRATAGNPREVFTLVADFVAQLNLATRKNEDVKLRAERAARIHAKKEEDKILRAKLRRERLRRRADQKGKIRDGHSDPRRALRRIQVGGGDGNENVVVSELMAKLQSRRKIADAYAITSRRKEEKTPSSLGAAEVGAAAEVDEPVCSNVGNSAGGDDHVDDGLNAYQRFLKRTARSS